MACRITIEVVDHVILLIVITILYFFVRNISLLEASHAISLILACTILIVFLEFIPTEVVEILRIEGSHRAIDVTNPLTHVSTHVI